MIEKQQTNRDEQATRRDTVTFIVCIFVGALLWGALCIGMFRLMMG